MRTNALIGWCRTHLGQLVSAIVLPLSFSIAGTGHNSWHLPGVWDLVMVLLAWLPLLVRERWPLPVLALVAVLDSARTLVVGHADPGSSTLPIATMLALYTVSTGYQSRTAWTGAVLVAVLQMIVPAVAFGWEGGYFFYVNWALVSTAVGRLEHERRDRIAAAEQRAGEAERTRQIEAERQVTAERVRIARELHDVLAHHITVVNAQAGVAQYLLRTDIDAAGQALTGIVANSRNALNELRATLGLLRSDRDSQALETARAPTPGLDQLDTLLAGFRDAGMHLTTTINGAKRPLTPHADIALYRIIQEALSNATKHAPGSDVHLQIDWSWDTVAATVTNTARASNGTGALLAEAMTGGGTGHGLIGMRERAAVANGTLTADPTPDGGYQVKVTLPIDTEHDAGTAEPPATWPEPPSQARPR